MPEAAAVQRFRTDALAVLGSYLEGLPDVRELCLSEVKTYSNRSFLYGWEITREFSDGARRLHVLIDGTFPFAPPRVVLVDRPEFLTWPHLEKDGALCLLPSQAAVSPFDPIAVLNTLLRSAVELIQSSIRGENLPDFQSEFNTYWNYRVTNRGKDALSLTTLQTKVDLIVRCWKGKSYDLFGDSDSQIREWLSNRYGREYSDGAFEDAGLFWVPKIPKPSEFPETAKDLSSLLGSRAILTHLVQDGAKIVRLLLAGESANGLVLFGVLVPPTTQKDVAGKKSNPLTKGFRPGHVPPTLSVERFLQTSIPVTRFSVKRVDHSWVHGRDRDPSQPRLRSTRVLVAGCGSLGSSVIRQLAQAGVGAICLIDDDDLEWPNISRHVLGADDVNSNKANAMASVLRVQFPHLSFEAQGISIEAATAKDPSLLAKNELIVNLTGSWAATALLNFLQKSHPGHLRTVHGWMERGAVAGHAVLVSRDACIQCGFDEVGRPSFQVAEWETPSTAQEPECGAEFEPYGSAEVAHCAALVTGLVIDALTHTSEESEHRLWIGSSQQLNALGGKWSHVWREHPEFKQEGGLNVSRLWPKSPECRTCKHPG